MNDYWTGFCAGVGVFSLVCWALFSSYIRCKKRLDKATDEYIATLKENYEDMLAEAIKATVAHDALLHVLRNRNDEGEEWKR